MRTSGSCSSLTPARWPQQPLLGIARCPSYVDLLVFRQSLPLSSAIHTPMCSRSCLIHPPGLTLITVQLPLSHAQCEGPVSSGRWPLHNLEGDGSPGAWCPQQGWPVLLRVRVHRRTQCCRVQTDCAVLSSLHMHRHILDRETPLPQPLLGGKSLPCPLQGQNLDLVNGTLHVLPLAAGMLPGTGVCRGLRGGVGRKATRVLPEPSPHTLGLLLSGALGSLLPRSPGEATLGPSPGGTAVPEAPSVWYWVLTPRGLALLASHGAPVS